MLNVASQTSAFLFNFKYCITPPFSLLFMMFMKPYYALICI